nr:hypothetical protein [Rhodospirillales bacterium]
AHRRAEATADRWAGRVLVEFGLTEAAAARAIATWLKNGVLEEFGFRDTAQRKNRRGLRVNDAKRPTMTTRTEQTA